MSGRLFHYASWLHKKPSFGFLPSRSKQYFSPPGKNMIFPCTTAAFTSPHFLQTGFVMLCSLTQGFGLLCDFYPSAHRFALRLLSDPRSPSRPCLRLVLFKVDLWSSSWKMYRGLTPHKIMPMPGTHNRVNSDG